LLCEAHGERKCAPLPVVVKHQLAALARQRGAGHLGNVGARVALCAHAADTLVTPIIASRSTSSASSASLMLSVPAGRSGSTR